MNELYRVVYHVVAPNQQHRETHVRYHAGGDEEEAIDGLLAGLQLEPGWRVESAWAVVDDEIVTYACESVGNFRRGDPIPRQHDRSY